MVSQYNWHHQRKVQGPRNPLVLTECPRWDTWVTCGKCGGSRVCPPPLSVKDIEDWFLLRLMITGILLIGMRIFLVYHKIEKVNGEESSYGSEECSTVWTAIQSPHRFLDMIVVIHRSTHRMWQLDVINQKAWISAEGYEETCGAVWKLRVRVEIKRWALE